MPRLRGVVGRSIGDPSGGGSPTHCTRPHRRAAISDTFWGVGVSVHWLDHALDLRTFFDEHACLPGTGWNTSDAERRLARWVKSQREADREGRLAASRATWLDEWVPAWRRPREAAWYATATAVGRHVAESGAYPSAHADDAETRRLGTWLRTQRRAHRDGRLDPSRMTWLTLNLPHWASPVTGAWFGTGGRLAEFVGEHGRMPRADGRDDEARLARWLAAQRDADRAGRLDAEQRTWLDDALPGWRSTRAANWECTAREVAAFRVEHGELPAPGGRRASEARLSTWLGTQRTAAANGTLVPARRTWLDTRIPDWTGPQRGRWADRLAETAAFIAQHGRPPARSGDAAERRIAAWVGAQRRAEREGRLTDERRSRLDALAPGWASAGEAAWRTRAAQLAAFTAAHGRLPAVREPDAEARGLAVWLGRQRALAGAGRLTGARERWLRLHVPGWRDHNLGAWLGTAERIVLFRAEHGRLPTRAASATPLERELGVWLNNQRNAERDGRLGTERARWLAEQLPDWQDSRLAAWLARAREVEQYVAERGRLPHPRSTNPRSRRLGGWLAAQHTAARAGRLKPNRTGWLDANLPGWAEVTARPALIAPAAVGTVAPSGPADDRATHLLREWTERLRARDGQLRADQRAFLDRRLPGWDQQSA
jgi:hypothetical protein